MRRRRRRPGLAAALAPLTNARSERSASTAALLSCIRSRRLSSADTASCGPALAAAEAPSRRPLLPPAAVPSSSRSFGTAAGPMRRLRLPRRRFFLAPPPGVPSAGPTPSAPAEPCGAPVALPAGVDLFAAASLGSGPRTADSPGGRASFAVRQLRHMPRRPDAPVLPLRRLNSDSGRSWPQVLHRFCSIGNLRLPQVCPLHLTSTGRERENKPNSIRIGRIVGRIRMLPADHKNG
ncbi:hypothetical protein [Gorillibacterium sp. CAU 1737]|uniref:hypothetical protein n=1 Tax=Gorillibacterium sp. CAU 1737 TaxID=3140362 RepID=UPI003261B61D